MRCNPPPSFTVGKLRHTDTTHRATDTRSPERAIPEFDEYMNQISCSHASEKMRQSNVANQSPEKRAKEETRRSYRSRYGGDYELEEYQNIAREDARFSQFCSNEPLRVMHRRGDVEVVTERRPRETCVERVENSYNVAMAQEQYHARIGTEPYQNDSDFSRLIWPEEGCAYEEQKFEKRFDLLKSDGNSSDSSVFSAYDHRGVECFRIPASNRDENQYKFKRYVGKTPKLHAEELRDVVAYPRGTYQGRKIRVVPPVIKPENEAFSFF